jgi:hypothetical protein
MIFHMYKINKLMVAKIFVTIMFTLYSLRCSGVLIIKPSSYINQQTLLVFWEFVPITLYSTNNNLHNTNQIITSMSKHADLQYKN